MQNESYPSIIELSYYAFDCYKQYALTVLYLIVLLRPQDTRMSAAKSPKTEGKTDVAWREKRWLLETILQLIENKNDDI